jgi:hypothetical protein
VDGAEGEWIVDGDRVVARGGKSRWLSTKEIHGDFELDLEYNVSPDGNSGVFLRAPREGNPWETAMEIQILDDDAPKHKDIKAWQHTGSIYGAVAPAKPAQKKAGEWNRMQILCVKNRVAIHLNGELIVDADLDKEEKLKAQPRRGFIGLQDHGTRCEFRNVRIRSEDPPPVRVLVPAYFYPTGEGLKLWERLIKTASLAHLVVVANPASGPGRKIDSNYARILPRLRKAGATIVGYVTTGYGKRAPEEIKADVDAWLRLYPGVIHGIFFDEQASGPERVDYQAAFYDYVRKEQRLELVITNPGTVCDEGYLARPAADFACLYENHEGFDEFRLPAWASKVPASRFIALSYKVKTADQMRERLKQTLARGFGFVCISDAEGDSPWSRLPSYWEGELEAVAGR